MKQSSQTNPILPWSFPERDSYLQYIAKALNAYISTHIIHKPNENKLPRIINPNRIQASKRRNPKADFHNKPCKQYQQIIITQKPINQKLQYNTLHNTKQLQYLKGGSLRVDHIIQQMGISFLLVQNQINQNNLTKIQKKSSIFVEL